MTTNEYIRGVKSGIFPPFNNRIWQRDYHKHIIRNEKSWETTHHCIQIHQQSWVKDRFFEG